MICVDAPTNTQTAPPILLIILAYERRGVKKPKERQFDSKKRKYPMEG